MPLQGEDFTVEERAIRRNSSSTSDNTENLGIVEENHIERCGPEKSQSYQTTTTTTSVSPSKLKITKMGSEVVVKDKEDKTDSTKTNLTSNDSLTEKINPKSESAPTAEGGFLARTSQLQGLEGDSPRGKIVWRNVIIFTYLHMAVLYGIFMIITGRVMWQTLVFSWLLHLAGGLGITAGAHRCWSHKAYKAKTPLKIILTLFQTIAFQNSVWEWVRDHRVHHKYSETHADPHNAKRGFFFAHIGWLLCRKHELVREKGKDIDMSDIEADPILAFQKKYHLPLGLLACFVLPAVIPGKLWGESFLAAFLIASVLRYAFTLHITWLVNSAAHMFGSKPYDKTINPSENKTVALWAFGEGWHNYHHVFPWDYKTAELGKYKYNLTTAFVDFFAFVGWAYDLKTVPKTIVEQRVKRTGDGSREHWDHHHHHENAPWGWGDKDIPVEDAKITQTLYASKED